MVLKNRLCERGNKDRVFPLYKRDFFDKNNRGLEKYPWLGRRRQKMTDKNFCMSSYLAFRYVEKDGVDFYPELHHQNIVPIGDDKKTPVRTADDIDKAIQKTFDGLFEENKKYGILLSGGMDSAILASYMKGCDAYTFRFLGGDFAKEELERAEYYARHYGLNLHYVDLDWNAQMKHLDAVVEAKNAPVHSIEPQLYSAAMQAKDDGVEHLVIGESSDLVFGGMDKLLAKEWTLEEFKNRYMFTNPFDVLKEPVSMDYLFERYRLPSDRIDFLSFMDNVFSIESSSSYFNAFKVAEIPYTDPYASLKMADPLDLNRVRNGEPKYLIRELFHKKYPEIPIPNKVPMPRPVDFYFEDWGGVLRGEFKNIDIKKFSGNQKWQLFCLEYFLNKYDK